MKKITYIVAIFLPLIFLLSCHQGEDIVANDPFEGIYSQQEITERGSDAPIECNTRYPFPVFPYSKISLLECNSRGSFSVIDAGTYEGDADIYYYVIEIMRDNGREDCSVAAKYDPYIKLLTGPAWGIEKMTVTRYMGWMGRRGSISRWVKSQPLIINCQ